MDNRVDVAEDEVSRDERSSVIVVISHVALTSVEIRIQTIQTYQHEHRIYYMVHKIADDWATDRAHRTDTYQRPTT